nr:MAG TPA: hypothetical protein [Caudoviricetes sp.]DAR94140.1 MAG TPA: hypothetical protein [Caudoviricetes sp.]
MIFFIVFSSFLCLDFLVTPSCSGAGDLLGF